MTVSPTATPARPASASCTPRAPTEWLSVAATSKTVTPPRSKERAEPRTDCSRHGSGGRRRTWSSAPHLAGAGHCRSNGSPLPSAAETPAHVRGVLIAAYRRCRAVASALPSCAFPPLRLISHLCPLSMSVLNSKSIGLFIIPTADGSEARTRQRMHFATG